MHGGSGADLIFGGSGHDRMYAGDGFDRVDAGPGYDWVYLGDGGDFFAAADRRGEGNDRVWGERGNDFSTPASTPTSLTAAMGRRP